MSLRTQLLPFGISLTTASVIVLALACAIPASRAVARDGEKDANPDRLLQPADPEAFAWRSVGPANMGGRVATIALAPAEPKTFYVGFATGGLWKTTNNGTTFTPIFDEEATASIGAYPDDEVKIEISFGDDEFVVRKLKGPNRPGFNRVVWDLQPEKDQRLGNPHGLPEFVPPGTYTGRLSCGDLEAETELLVLPAPSRD